MSTEAEIKGKKVSARATTTSISMRMVSIFQRTHDEDDESNGAAETTTATKKKATPVKAATSTTKSRAPNDEDEESREETNDEDSNSVGVAGLAKKRNGKPTSTDAGASGKSPPAKRPSDRSAPLVLGDPDESGDYDEEDDEASDDGKEPNHRVKRLNDHH